MTTKLHIPPLRRGLVSRPRLMEQLELGLAQNGISAEGTFPRKLTLISAPAGYRKTTLLSEWAARRGRLEPEMRFAWLSLDKRDNDPAHHRLCSPFGLKSAESRLSVSNARLLEEP
jgi:LuxR family maltose regulon positive regulatory protein